MLFRSLFPVAQPALWFASPLRYGERLLGSVVIALPENNHFVCEKDAHVLASVADHLALAISRNATEKR